MFWLDIPRYLIIFMQLDFFIYFYHHHQFDLTEPFGLLLMQTLLFTSCLVVALEVLALSLLSGLNVRVLLFTGIILVYLLLVSISTHRYN